MSIWALLFITFVKVNDSTYSFQAGKLPYQLHSEQECTDLKKELRTVSPTTKGEFVCIKISKDNTT